MSKTIEKHDLDSLLELNKRINQITQKLGNLDIRRLELDLERDQIKSEYLKLLEEQQKIGESLHKKYGEGIINLKDGIIES